MNNFEYDYGMRVVVFIPEGENLRDYDVFNAGWDNDMYDYIGREGVVISEPHDPGLGTGLDYRIEFEDGETWWWDERYMRPADAAIAAQFPTIEESDFSDILS